MKTVAKKYIALFDTKLSIGDQSSWLEHELLNYLDDRHQAVSMLRHKRLPNWIKKSMLISNIYYGYQLLFHQRTMIILDSKLLPKYGLMIKLVKQLKRHLVIITGSSIKQELDKQPGKLNQWLYNLTLKAMDFYFIDTAVIHQWLIEKHVEHSKIMVMANSLNYHQPVASWGIGLKQSKAIRKIRQRQFNRFFEHVA